MSYKLTILATKESKYANSIYVIVMKTFNMHYPWNFDFSILESQIKTFGFDLISVLQLR
jgi:hypothetical protein